MKTLVPDPERWSDRASEGDASPEGEASEDLMGAALRRVREATTPSEAWLSRLGAGRRASRVVRVRRPWRALALALASLFVVVGTVGATRGTWRAWAVRRGLVASPTPAPSPSDFGAPGAARVSHEARIAPPTLAIAEDGVSGVVEEAAPGLAPPANEAPALSGSRARPARARPTTFAGGAPLAPPAAPVAPPAQLAPPAAPPPEASLEEAELLARAFRALRAEHAPERALVTLDEHDRRFPTGALGGEARLARAEALVALGRDAEAAPLLRGLGERLDRATGGAARNVGGAADMRGAKETP